MALTDQAATLPLDFQVPDLGEHILVVDKARVWCSEKVPEPTGKSLPPMSLAENVLWQPRESTREGNIPGISCV